MRRSAVEHRCIYATVAMRPATHAQRVIALAQSPSQRFLQLVDRAGCFTLFPPTPPHLRPSQAVPEREREELFADAMREKERKEKEARRLEKQRKSAALRAVLEDLGIKVSSGRGWRRVVA